MRILLVEPSYYSKYPPLGLLKLGKLEERKWNNVNLVNGTSSLDFEPDKIYITSLFTYSWKPVHEAIEYYHKHFPSAEIRVGGIYATLMPQNIKKTFPYVKVHLGLVKEAEGMLPAYHLLKQVEKWKNWDRSIVFTSRGCIRKCQFCVVPKVEGGMRDEKPSIQDLMHPNHKKVTIWDNNFLASPYAKSMLRELIEQGIEADFNQGLDARLMDEETAGLLADVKSKTIHMAYDWPWEGPYIKKAINLLGDAGYKKKNLIFYMLHNFWDEQHKKGDTPADFLLRLKNLMEWGASVYPMRFIPLNSLTRTGYVSPLWTADQLEMVADARRVLGFAGTWVPYKALADKFIQAESFEYAMELRPKQDKDKDSIFPLPVVEGF
ncbi:MAG: radical SAM protein [Cuniculiplasma sp.]